MQMKINLAIFCAQHSELDSCVATYFALHNGKAVYFDPRGHTTKVHEIATLLL